MTNIRKVLLINPPSANMLLDSGSLGYSYFEPPLGVMYVYSFLKKRGDLDVTLVDLNVEYSRVAGRQSLDSLVEYYCKIYEPDLVGIAALYYSDIKVFHKVAKLFKKYRSESIIIMGGHYPSLLTECCLEDETIDYAVLSEGETGLSDLINALNHGTPLEEVEGLGYREGAGIRINPRIHFWKEFKNTPALDFSAIPFEKYFKEGRMILDRIYAPEDIRPATLTASRGCPNKCRFCSSPTFWRRRWRARDVESVVNEMQGLIDKYGVNTFLFNDENICANTTWFRELLDKIAPLKINWMSYGGLQVSPLADQDLVARMYDSGICLFNLAIESGVDQTLERIHKPLTVDKVYRAVENINIQGEKYSTGFFITGFPFETREEVIQTLDFAMGLQIDWKCFYCFQPFPGTELYKECLDQGLIESFNPDYKESFYPPKMKHVDYTVEELGYINYMANLRCNFLDNINLNKGTTQGLEQARRDFAYVDSIAGGHVLALHGLARVEQLNGNTEEAQEYLAKAMTALQNAPEQWELYLKELGLKLEMEHQSGR